MVVSALSTVWSFAATCPANELRFSVAADDVVGLSVQLRDERVQLGQQAAQVGLAARQRLGERLVDLLQLAQPAAVEQDRHRCQRLLGGRIGAGRTTAE